MSADAIDPVVYKAEQVDHWNAVAQGWARWWPTFEQGGQALSDRLVTLADVQPGDAVLDVATGIGEPAVSAARVVEGHGRVIGIDQAPRMLETARGRAAERGLTQISFQLGDAEALDFQDEFDAALSRWGLMLIPNPNAVLDGLHRALRPGARFAASVWSVPERVPFIHLVQTAIQEVLQPPAPSEDALGPFRLADPDRLQAMVEAQGFRGVHTERLTVELAWASADEFVAFHQDVSPPMIELAHESEATQAAVRSRLKDLAEGYAQSDGRVRLPNETICVAGTK